jgi:NAD(P)-dependent dehydrogenase (short-subunit alcohol dehydrogenase family)
MKTVMITGCSSGYGLETARHFHAQGWNVIATMRTPRPELLPRSERLRVLGLDVTKPESIEAALQASGPIDALVNNAGIGLFGAFEATPMAMTREVFETNTFGVMAMTQSVLPRFRARRSGVVVNVTSSATLMPMPLVAVYTASKTAIEGFTASLAFELEAFNVRVKLVEPGYGPNTRFTSNTGPRMDGLIPEPYVPFAQSILASVGQRTGVTTEFDVAEAGVPGRDRCVWPAAFSSGRRRGGAGSVDIGDHVVARSGTVPAHAVERDWRHEVSLRVPASSEQPSYLISWRGF